MEDLVNIKKFIQESQDFKKTQQYQSMPGELRDFFNEELGRMKLVLELGDSCQAGQKKNSEK